VTMQNNLRFKNELIANANAIHAHIHAVALDSLLVYSGIYFIVLC